MIDNWIEEDITCKNTVKKSKKNEEKIENETMFKLLFLVLGSSCLFWSSLNADCISCPHCNNQIETQSHIVGFFGDTWICPNRNCGYENYDAINYCGICGTSKP